MSYCLNLSTFHLEGAPYAPDPGGHNTSELTHSLPLTMGLVKRCPLYPSLAGGNWQLGALVMLSGGDIVFWVGLAGWLNSSWDFLWPLLLSYVLASLSGRRPMWQAAKKWARKGGWEEERGVVWWHFWVAMNSSSLNYILRFLNEISSWLHFFPLRCLNWMAVHCNRNTHTNTKQSKASLIHFLVNSLIFGVHGSKRK